MELRIEVKETDVGVIPMDWSVKPLGELAEVIMGQSPLGSTYNRSGEGIALINGPTEFTENHPVKVQWTTQPTKICKDSDLLICVRGSSTGRMNVSNGEYCIGRGVAAIRAKSSSNTVYLTNQIQLGIEKLLSFSAGSTFPNVDGKSIRSILIPIPPSIDEQNSIAIALSDVDALIQSMEKLIDKKLAIKNGAIQELLRPKDDWVVKKLPNVCWFQEGPGLRNWQFKKEGIKVINVTNLENGYLNLDRTDRYISLDEFNKMYRHFEIQEGDIVVASSGNSYGKTAVVRKQDLPLLMNTSVIRFKPLEGLDYNFLLVFLKSNIFKDQVDLLITGGAQPNFGPAHLNKIDIVIPKTVLEQTQIATILSDMEAEIEAIETKLIKYKKIKQGMMQNLLTGRVRLV